MTKTRGLGLGVLSGPVVAEDNWIYAPMLANCAQSGIGDARCAKQYDVWGAGFMRQIAGGGCQMQRTAQPAFALRDYRSTCR